MRPPRRPLAARERPEPDAGRPSAAPAPVGASYVLVVRQKALGVAGSVALRVAVDLHHPNGHRSRVAFVDKAMPASVAARILAWLEAGAAGEGVAVVESEAR